MLEYDMALDLGRDALLTALLVAGPILLIGMIVGLGISLLQTLTQVQDQTFSIVPKITAMLGAAVFFIPWIATRLLDYTRMMFADW